MDVKKEKNNKTKKTTKWNQQRQTLSAVVSSRYHAVIPLSPRAISLLPIFSDRTRISRITCTRGPISLSLSVDRRSGFLSLLPRPTPGALPSSFSLSLPSILGPPGQQQSFVNSKIERHAAGQSHSILALLYLPTYLPIPR